jgi:hypothetical protein
MNEYSDFYDELWENEEDECCEHGVPFDEECEECEEDE